MEAFQYPCYCICLHGTTLIANLHIVANWLLSNFKAANWLNEDLRTCEKNLLSSHTGPLSRHTVVCRAAQENRGRANCMSILTEQQSCDIHNSIIFYLKNTTKVAVEMPAYQGRLHTKIKENWAVLPIYEWANFQVFSSCFSFVFSHTWKIAVTRKLVLQSSWNLVHL